MATGKPTDRLAEWHQEWESGAMDEFAVNKPHPKMLELYDQYIQGKQRAKVFVPLCGDSHDMRMLADRGHEIVGVECSEVGIKTFLKKHNLEYTQEPCPQVKGSLFKSKDGNYRFYSCDIFNFNVDVEGQFDVIMDFGSMGALLRPDLQGYADIMKRLLKPDGRHIMELFIYDLEKYPASRPVYLPLEQMKQFYGDQCNVQILVEGPNPYADEYSEQDTNQGEGHAEGHEDGGDNSDMVPFPDLTGAVYYLITKK